MNWDLSVSWTRTTRTQSKNTNPEIKKKKKKIYRSKQIATKYKLDPEKSTL